MTLWVSSQTPRVELGALHSQVLILANIKSGSAPSRLSWLYFGPAPTNTPALPIAIWPGF